MVVQIRDFSPYDHPVATTIVVLYHIARQSTFSIQTLVSFVADNAIVESSTPYMVRHWLQVIIAFAYLYMFLYRVHNPNWTSTKWKTNTMTFLLAFLHWMCRAHGYNIWIKGWKKVASIQTANVDIPYSLFPSILL